MAVGRKKKPTDFRLTDMASKKKTLRSLKEGRPPTARSARSMSRKASRALINSHHQLEKRRFQAAMTGNKEAETAIRAEIASIGGLGRYQKASLQGQSADRGGDTSRVLHKWLPASMTAGLKQRLRMLEVGALSTHNCCSTSGLFDMVHIDLHSQERGIVQQDFMDRPLPSTEADKFDIISLSLVLNFVPDAEGRGQMLLRTLSFLRESAGGAEDKFPTPSLFLVLPRSCVDNSRYLTEASLGELMGALGYRLAESKTTQKLAYSLWKRAGHFPSTDMAITKQEINPGRARNNFSITLRYTASKPT